MGYPTAQELEALARETEELKKIKEAMGSDVYGKTVFDKIFTRDIERLLSMEEMWKNRTPPTPLFYDELVQYMTTDSATTTSGLKDQHIWSIRECFDMFVDRYVCISSLALRHDRTSK
jgi:ubiquitin-like 1-activating enzyme E1 B